MMRRVLSPWLTAFAGILSAALAARAEEVPFAVAPLHETPTHTIHEVRFRSATDTGDEVNDTVAAEYYLPAGLDNAGPPRPAVVCLHILNGNFELVRLMCSALAERGIPAIWFPLPGYGTRGTPEGRRAMLADADRFTRALDQGMSDLKRTVDFLQSRPEINPQAIGVAGISLGAFVGGAACGNDLRIGRACLILGGGDLPAVIAGARETRGLRTSLDAMDEDSRNRILGSLRAMDPLTHAGRLKELADSRKLLLIRAENDEVVPPSCTDTLVQATGDGTRIEVLPGAGHYTALASLPVVLRSLGDFFAEDLPEGVAPPVPEPGDRSPEQLLATLAGGLAAFLMPVPREGTCHLLAADVVFTPAGGRERRGNLDVATGYGGSLRLACDIPGLGSLSLGDGEQPWMVSRKGTLFSGTGEPGQSAFALLDPAAALRVRTAAAVLSAVAIAPQAFAKQLTLSSETGDDGRLRLHIRVNAKGDPIEAEVTFREDGRTPDTLQVRVGDAGGTVTFRRWLLHAPANPELFRAPECPATVPVPAPDLRRMFAATSEFLLRRIR